MPYTRQAHCKPKVGAGKSTIVTEPVRMHNRFRFRGRIPEKMEYTSTTACTREVFVSDRR